MKEITDAERAAIASAIASAHLGPEDAHNIDEIVAAAIELMRAELDEEGAQ